MDLIKKIVIITILISFLGLHFPRTGFSWPNSSPVKTAEATGITRHEPEFLAPPEVGIPVETQLPGKVVGKRKINKWLWVGLGAVAAGAAVALGGGGGGGDGGSSTPSEGDITIKWNE